MKSVKRLLMLSTLIAMLPLYAHSQVQQGDWFISGGSSFSTGYSKEFNKDNKSFSLSLRPSIGKAITEDFLAGLDIRTGYTHATYEEPATTFNTFSLSAGPFLRYYIGGETVRPFVEARTGAGKTWPGYDMAILDPADPSQVITLTDPGYNLFTAQAGAGISFFVRDNLSIDTGLYYEYERTRLVADEYEQSPTEQGHISMFVGFALFLG